MRGLQNKMANRFLIIRWSGMGDVVMTLPAVKWLLDQFPNGYICYLTDRSFAKIPELSGHVHRIETIDRRGFIFAKRLLPAAIGTLTTVYRLRRMQFDVTFDLQGFGETSILAYLTGAPVRVGRIKNSSLRKRLYTTPIQADWEREHRSDYFLRAVREAIGHQTAAPAGRPQLPIPSENTHTARRRIGLYLGASTESRRWSEHHFFRLAENLSKKGFMLRFFLGPQESFLISPTKKTCQRNGWEFVASNDLKALIQSLSECHLLVSNDTGPGHVAAALNISVVTLFSTGSPENVRPLAKKARWFKNEKNINQITVSEVENACLELLY
jgi:heptosyltransferase-1